MYFTIILIVISVFFIVLSTYYRARQLWLNAKPKHRQEHLDIYLYIGPIYLNSGVRVARAYMPLFECAQFKYFGLTFRGVQIIIYNQNGEIYYGERAGERGQKWTYDVGVAGMSPTGHTPHETAEEEIYEEVGLRESDIILVYNKTITPAAGASCIIDIFHAHQINNKKLKSHDGTYSYIKTIPAHNFIKEFYNLPHKGRLTKNDTLIILTSKI